MEIIFKSKNFELTSSIEDYVRKKIETLGKFLKNFNQEIIKFEVEVGRTTHHYKSGDIFRAEINLSLGGRLLRVESEREDLFNGDRRNAWWPGAGNKEIQNEKRCDIYPRRAQHQEKIRAVGFGAV